MTCSAGDLLTSREAAHPAAYSLEASWIKHKSSVATGQVGGQEAPGRANAPAQFSASRSPMNTFSVAWKRTRTRKQETRGVHSSSTTYLLCSLEQVTLPLWALVLNSLK